MALQNNPTDAPRTPHRLAGELVVVTAALVGAALLFGGLGAVVGSTRVDEEKVQRRTREKLPRQRRTNDVSVGRIT